MASTWQRLRRGDHGLGRAYRGVASEVRKVVWPSREHALRLTALVCAVSAAVGAVLGGLDVGLGGLFGGLLGAP